MDGLTPGRSQSKTLFTQVLPALNFLTRLIMVQAAHRASRQKLSLSMVAGRASTAVLCLLCIGLAAAAFPGTIDVNERDTCYSALDTLQSCNEGLASQDLQQLCCIPFHALEGMKCFW